MELSRLGTRAFLDALLAGGVIGIPPILNFGSPEVQAKVVPEVLSGKKYICLAITGPSLCVLNLIVTLMLMLGLQRHSPEVMSLVYRQQPCETGTSG